MARPHSTPLDLLPAGENIGRAAHGRRSESETEGIFPSTDATSLELTFGESHAQLFSEVYDVLFEFEARRSINFCISRTILSPTPQAGLDVE